ncbi:MAG TPA: HD-GYP domain-containing protein [Actinomycetota bacterium]|nr:HD-GYP domain-containing protein [Actinomycetota bacterium]
MKDQNELAFPPQESDPHAELERTRSQLLVFARDMSAVYQRKREQEQRLGRLMEDLSTDYLSIVETLALVVEAKDPYTAGHLERCKKYGVALTEEIDPGLISPQLQYGFLLHDVGKIGIPESILIKNGPLTADEARVMRTHPLIGVQIVGPMHRILDQRTVEVIRHHHERFDGQGYPDRRKGDDIPLSARIFCVVDAFDAMTTQRPYRAAMPWEEAAERLRVAAGTQFDPDVVRAFDGLIAEGADSLLKD